MMALVNIALYCSKAERRVPVGWGGGVGGGGGANRFSCQTHNQVNLGCFWVGLLLLCLVWGYDKNLMKTHPMYHGIRWLFKDNTCTYFCTALMIHCIGYHFSSQCMRLVAFAHFLPC